ncbi:heme-binding domain-containing protein [Robertkochia solimangrovi]|uniref:heme-binding domain-containing protein n=1 Tax=Robertkochia solimangrovi TaxID=2213046 RepID=UPI00117C0324|nr:heme-binding domain-containing protein [Robertkochia solimangrovi]TRZ43645.1 cytochrome C [Robertkochia solimangrovi]
MRIVKKILVFLLLVLILMQFFQPEKNHSDTTPPTDIIMTLHPSEEVEAILTNACYDCHSNNTNYPWYANVAPVSYWLNDHIEDGKRKLDFSKWDSYSDKRKSHKLEEVIELVRDRHMPLDSYTWMHPEAKLTDDQINQLIAWADREMATFSISGQPQ